jgi:uncharacterized membrane protein
MQTLEDVQAAADALSPEQREELRRYLLVRQRESEKSPPAHLVRRNGDVLLEAPSTAPAMTPAFVKQLLEDWP